MFRHLFPDGNTRALQYIITHVFCPLQLPPGDDHSVSNDHSLAKTVLTAALAYHTSNHLGDAEKARWDGLVRMLDHLKASVKTKSMGEEHIVNQLSGMKAGDTLAFLIRAQKAAVVFKKQVQDTLYESYVVSPSANASLTTRGKLICTYPGASIAIPNDVFDESLFRSELAHFLACMDRDLLNGDGYITDLLTGILRAVGHQADSVHICKRVGDDAINIAPKPSQHPWRRSPLWLLIRVVVQSSLTDAALPYDSYKAFMLFFMCLLAEQASQVDLSSDLLHFMSAKLSKRLGKFGSSAPDWLSQRTQQTCARLRGILEDRWKLVKESHCRTRIWTPPSQPDLVRDMRLSLLNGGNYIHNAFNNGDPNFPDTTFRPNHHPRGKNLNNFLTTDGAFFEEAYRREPQVALYDVEQVVEKGLDAWVARVTDIEEACVQLEILAEKYLSGAKNIYANNPELLSVMLLTGIELWIALDKLAIKHIPILADYCPEIPLTLLESLLLRKTTSFHRLSCAYEYLSKRHSSLRSRTSVFSSEVTAATFAVRYYNESHPLQQLRSCIEEDAKLYFHPWNHLRLSSPMYEYPMPGELLLDAVIAFELRCPVVFDMWRAVTFHILGHRLFPHWHRDDRRAMDVSELTGPSQQSMQGLLPHIIQPDKDSSLLPYFVKHPRACISVRFITLRMRGAIRPVAPTAFDNVCLYHHSLTNAPRTLLDDITQSSKDHLLISYQLPPGPYYILQKYMDATSHLPNEVLASQAQCNPALSLHEFLAFGHLRSGGSVQWLNILRELRSRTLNFRRHEVHLLITQAATQVGPLVEGECSVWHSELRDPLFCRALLEELRCLAKDVEANWREAMTMATISLLLSRLLASQPSSDISAEALQLLSDVREKTFIWVQELSEKFIEAHIREEHEEFRWLLLDAATICRSTSNVLPHDTIRDAPPPLRNFLCSSRSIEILISCAVLICDSMPSDPSSIPAQSRLLLDRDRRLSLALEDILRDAMKDDPLDDGIDRALCRLRPAYRRGPNSWRALEFPNSRWLTCETVAAGNSPSQTVHLNLLEGTVLVDGKRLSTLPKLITQHPLYSLVFGNKIFNVVHSELPRTDFMTQQIISGHQVYFALRNGDLIIRAKRQDCGKILELIPQDKLKGDLPTVLVKGYAHWLDISASKPVIEIRPLENIWVSSSLDWILDCTPGQCRMYNSSHSLLNIRSPSFVTASSLFEMLDIPHHVIVTVPVSPTQPTPLSLGRMLVSLPRYGLSFFVDEEGDLQSNNFRGMVYDQDQSIGAMFGLVNRLVLRPKIQVSEELDHRRVLIPDGDVTFSRQGHHVCVKIITPHSPLHRVTYQTYTVDVELGCLIGNVGLTNKLYLAYLHAVTSNGCCADPLTGRTGTEEALWLLQSAGCQSILKFGSREAELLCLIASLCPRRRIVKDKETSQLKWQTVEWLDLPVSAQYPGLYAAAKAIKKQCQRVQLFYQDSNLKLQNPFATFPLYGDHVFDRSLARAAFLIPLEFTGKQSWPQWDTRHQSEVGWGESRAYMVASAVYRWSINSGLVKNLKKQLTPTSRVGQGVVPSQLRYHRTWLWQREPSISSWIKAYGLFQHSQKSDHQFQLLFTLPALANGRANLVAFAQTLLAVAVHPQFRTENIPENIGPDNPDGPAFEMHLARVQRILNTIHVSTPRSVPHIPYVYKPLLRPPCRELWSIGMDEVLSRTPPPRLELPDKPPRHGGQGSSSAVPLQNYDALHQLITSTQENATNLFQRQYACRLHASVGHLRDNPPDVATHPITIEKSALESHYARCRHSLLMARDFLKEQLAPKTEREKALALAGLWPRLTTSALFRCLASTSPVNLSEEWKASLISFALLALEFQRARRLLRLALDNQHDNLSKELQNEGCDGWDAKNNPDWLLIQLQGNFLIRGVQVDIAKEMIAPKLGKNTLMQLNMGEGKSSVIVPISAATLADGNQLVRVIVPKALTAQMFHLLVDRLGGLANRRIYFLPFSRSLMADIREIHALHEVVTECMRDRGILVSQPEHVLSLRLTSIERQMADEEVLRDVERKWSNMETSAGLETVSSTEPLTTIEERLMGVEEKWTCMEDKWIHMYDLWAQLRDLDQWTVNMKGQRKHLEEEWTNMAEQWLRLGEQWGHIEDEWGRAEYMQRYAGPSPGISLEDTDAWLRRTDKRLTVMEGESARTEGRLAHVEKQWMPSEEQNAERLPTIDEQASTGQSKEGHIQTETIQIVPEEDLNELTPFDGHRRHMKKQEARIKAQRTRKNEHSNRLKKQWVRIDHSTKTDSEGRMENTDTLSLIEEQLTSINEHLKITELELTKMEKELRRAQGKLTDLTEMERYTKEQSTCREKQRGYMQRRRMWMRNRWDEMQSKWKGMETEMGTAPRTQSIWRRMRRNQPRPTAPSVDTPVTVSPTTRIVIHPLLNLQRWLHEHVRDILDECDEVLHVRFQLVYTTGKQRNLEAIPSRWTITQQVLGFVKKRASTLASLFPLETEYEPGAPASFPRIRIQQAVPAQQLVSWLSEDVMNHLLPRFTLSQVRSGLRDAVHAFISQKDIPASTAKMVDDHFGQHGNRRLWDQILLLRGLLANGILLFALQERRWRVDYGLASTRTMLAVPYRAKDTPAPQAEYGHPDVVIILTCLSYYYGGLTEAQLRLAFETLLKLDDPSTDYTLWVEECTSLPDSLHNVSAINLISSEQWRQYLFPLFACNQATVNFFLSRVVFPKEAKEFPLKLSGSSWDLAEQRKNIITGFSGTNDGRYLLPTSITQRDPEHQQGTNAKVLAYLLQEENCSFQPMAHHNGQRWSTRQLLGEVTGRAPEIRVLLDVGAQILDLENHQLAQTWLSCHPDAQAAIYFNGDDELTALTRDGATEPLFSSPFAKQLDQCVIYLDHAHTRGTDIKFPSGFRAAVTLGPKVTKDALVQGCMRMRMLGRGHSVMFFAPLEVDRKIRSATGKGTADNTITTTDILHWVISETCNNIQTWAPHWAQQGMDHISRYDAWSRFCRDEVTPDELTKRWLQQEAKSLVELYAPRTPLTITTLYPEIHSHCVELGFLPLGGTATDEEQEREIIYEKLPVVQGKPPPPSVSPALHSIHRDVITFVETGTIPHQSTAFRPIFSTLSSTPANVRESHVWSRAVLATKDFCRTVTRNGGKAAHYLRPVQWVVSSCTCHCRMLVLFSPFEVNELMPVIRASKNVHLHIYTPRTTKSMRSCDDLQLYSIPSVPSNWTPVWHLIDQLNVFAGQLYFRDYEAYKRLCNFLCIYTEDMRNDTSLAIQPDQDGFIPPTRKKWTLALPGRSGKRFQQSPLPFIRVLVGLRIKGRGFIETQMGSILEGRPLTRRDFEN